MPDDEIFSTLRRSLRVWAVASIHGEAERLDAMHKELFARLEPGDRIVYLGNYLGHGAGIRATMDNLLRFRRAVIARPGMFAADVVHLRGSQEEMWQKLLQLQFAPNPAEVLRWMLDQGVGPTLATYGGDAERALVIFRQGAMAITRWTGELREALQRTPGHYSLLVNLRRAAFTDDGALLFVHAGVDVSRPLLTQSDALWWGSDGFSKIDRSYSGFKRIVRGFDRSHPGVQLTDWTASIDGGCGSDGKLIAACFDPDGGITDRIEV